MLTMPTFDSNRWRWMMVLLPLVAMAGCTGYRLGSTLPKDIRTIYIPMFVNKSGEPNVEIEATRAAIEEFQKDGSLRVATERQSDARIDVTMTGFSLEPIEFQRERATTPESYRLLLTASIVFSRSAAGTTTRVVLLRKSNIQGESTFSPTADLISAKREAMPEAAKDLAHDIVESVVEYW